MKLDAKSTIEAGKAILGIEFGSTRIKARKTSPLLKEVTPGRTSWLTDFGHIALRPSGMACKIVTPTFAQT